MFDSLIFILYLFKGLIHYIKVVESNFLSANLYFLFLSTHLTLTFSNIYFLQ